MRKARQLVLILLTIIFFTACGGGGKPDDVSEDMYETAVYAIKVVDLYLDGEATLEDTYEKLNNMKVPDYEMEYPYTDFSINSSIIGLKTCALSLKTGDGQISDLKSKRDEIAEAINYKD